MLHCMQQHCLLTKVLCAMKMSMPNGNTAGHVHAQRKLAVKLLHVVLTCQYLDKTSCIVGIEVGWHVSV